MGLLSGKVAVVTGAGRGIGRATALLFAQEGAAIVVNDLGVGRAGEIENASVASEVVAEIHAIGGRAVANTDDAATHDGARAILEQALTNFDRVDILVNNAGIVRDKTLLKLDEATFRAVLETDLMSTFFCTQFVARHMKEQGSGGKIINTTSLAALLGNFAQANAAAAKAGIYALTRTASIELQRFGICVNAVAPLAKTRMTEDLPIFEHVDSMRAEHVAPVHLFLASELCADLTGVVVSVAGGKLSIYKLVESHGKFKEGAAGIWTAQEIAEHWEAISKL